MGIFDRFLGGNEKPPAASPDAPAPQFPYELVRVAGADAVQQCLAWRAEWRGSFTPVILGTAENIDFLNDARGEENDPPQEIVQSAQAVEIPFWFEERVEDTEFAEGLLDASDWNTHSGTGSEFLSVSDILSRKVHPWLWVAKVPAATPFELPAYLQFGGWNACPDASEHVAVWRYWQEKYGAEILCATGDIIEATVARPPATKEECYALAHEQFSYCEDIVTQGVGTVDALAATLYGGKSWYFWWD